MIKCIDSETDPCVNSTQCFDRESLTQYLAGWVDERAAELVETHLKSCSSCESLCNDLEQDRGGGHLLNELLSRSIDKLDPDIALAVAAAKQGIALTFEKQPYAVPIPLQMSSIGPYELLEVLGRGGMGIVYLARHSALKKLVAIKLIPIVPGLENEQIRFDREILAIGKMQHPAIVTATDAGKQTGFQYLVMEYIRGSDLGRLSRAMGPMNVSDVCEIGYQVSMGLIHAHSAGVIHRDIKPSNIMLDDSGAVKILDFGLVQLDRWDGVANEFTTIGYLLGTLDYMAPEQAERCAVDYRADLYALGATLYKLLCGRAPLANAPNQSPIDKLRLLADHQPPKLKTLRPDVPPQLANLIDQLLCTHPQDRPPSAAHVAEQLQDMKDGADLKAVLQRWNFQAKETTPNAGAIAPQNEHSRQIFAPKFPSTPRRNWYKLAWIASLPCILLGGILVSIETSKGQLVIESEVADVHVKIMRGEDIVKELEIHPGSQSTRLRADKYEVRIEAPSDTVIVDNQQFVLKSGQVIVARIQQPTSKSNQTTMSPLGLDQNRSNGNEFAKASQKQTDTLYRGENLQYWLTVLRRETDRDTWLKAFEAVNTLADQNTKRQLRSEIIRQCFDYRRFSRVAEDGVQLNAIAKWGAAIDLPKYLSLEMKRRPLEDQEWLLALILDAQITIPELSASAWDPVWKVIEEHARSTSLIDFNNQQLIGSIGLLLNSINPNGSDRPTHATITYLFDHYPNLSRLYFLLPACSHMTAESSSARSPRNSATLTEVLESLTNLQLTVIEDDNVPYADRIVALDLISQAKSQGLPEQARIGKAIDSFLIRAAQDKQTLLLEIPYKKASGYVGRYIPASSPDRTLATSIIFDALVRLPQVNQTQKGLRALYEATQPEYEAAIREIPGLASDQAFWRIDVASYPSKLQPTVSIWYFHKLAESLIPKPVLDSMAVESATANFSRDGLPTDADKAWVDWCIRRLSALDHDKNGQIDPSEWHQSAGDFSRCDANQDGFITLSEYYEYRRIAAK